MVIQILEFIFASFWRWAGTVVILAILTDLARSGLAFLLAAIARATKH